MSEATVTELPLRFPVLEGLRVLVVGGGKSGLAAARLAADNGARVTIADRRDESAWSGVATQARELGATVHPGGHPATLADSADLLVLSPGVPPSIELVRRAIARGLPVWGEVELGSRFCHGRVIAITGSNGKSTVTSMVGTILRHAGIPGGTGGNLGRPFCDLLDDDADDAVHAVELSSFQIETLHSLRPEVAVVLNLSPDHLDRYESFDAYAAAKRRLLELQRGDAAAVLNADDPRTAEWASRGGGARPFRFSVAQRVDGGAFLDGSMLTLKVNGSDEPVCSVDELTVRGEHNVANALAAALCCRLVGCTPAAIADGLRRFEPLPHRLVKIAELRGVGYYDDSKATNPDSTARALGAFDAGSVQIILGGRDKGSDWTVLVDPLRTHAARILLIGECSAELRSRFAGVAPIVECETLDRAVTVAAEGAQAGQTVLLSPACASFDQFANFEDRGRAFARAIAALEGQDG